MTLLDVGVFALAREHYRLQLLVALARRLLRYRDALLAQGQEAGHNASYLAALLLDRAVTALLALAYGRNVRMLLL